VLPVVYKSTANAWMTAVVFKQWCDENFVPQVGKFLRDQNMLEIALLLIDNASSHCSENELTSDDGKIVTKFLPPNTTALIQPMDQNAICFTKLFYRKSLLAEILTNNEKDLVKCLKQLNLKMAVCLLHNAWEKVPPTALEKCWKKIVKPLDEYEDDPDDLLPLSVLTDRIRSSAEEIDEVHAMLRDIGDADINEADVVAWIDGNAVLTQGEGLGDVDENYNSDDDIEVLESAPVKVTNEDAVKSFNVCLQWAAENDVPLMEIMTTKTKRNGFFLCLLGLRSHTKKVCWENEILHYFQLS